MDRCESTVNDWGRLAAEVRSEVRVRGRAGGGAYDGFGSAADDRWNECGADDRDDAGLSKPDTVAQEAAVSFLKFRNCLTPPSFKTTNTQAWRSL